MKYDPERSIRKLSVTLAPTTADNSVLILKELVLHNTDGSAIYLPTVDYSYTITEATVASGTTVNDGTVTAVVYADDTTSRALQTTSATVSFSPSTTAGYDSTIKNDRAEWIEVTGYPHEWTADDVKSIEYIEIYAYTNTLHGAPDYEFTNPVLIKVSDFVDWDKVTNN